MSRRKLFQTSKGSLEYTDNGSGEALLAVHGAMGAYDQSEVLAKTIAPEGYRVIAVSRPGYWGTPLESGKTGEEQADLYKELLDHLTIEKAIVMAVSGGGYSSIFFAHRYPQRCRGLVLCSTPGGPNDEKIPFTFKIMQFMATFPFLIKGMQKKAVESFEKSLERSIPHEDMRKAFLADSETSAMFRKMSSDMFIDMNLRLEGTKNDIIQTRDLVYPLKEITVPVLIVHGAEDDVVPFEKHAKRLINELPNAELFEAERGGHVTIFTHRKEVCEKVAQFLDRI